MGQDTSTNKDRIAEFLRKRGEATNAAQGTDQPKAQPPKSSSKYRGVVEGLNEGVKAPKRPGTPGGEASQSMDEIKKRIDRLMGGQ